MKNLCTTDCRPVCNIAHERIALERRIVRRFIREAKKDGWTPFAVNNGEEIIAVSNETDALTQVFEVDESSLRFRHTTRNVRSFVAIILGNGVDCLVDCGDMLGATYDRVSDIFEER